MSVGELPLKCLDLDHLMNKGLITFVGFFFKKAIIILHCHWDHLKQWWRSLKGCLEVHWSVSSVSMPQQFLGVLRNSLKFIVGKNRLWVACYLQSIMSVVCNSCFQSLDGLFCQSAINLLINDTALPIAGLSGAFEAVYVNECSGSSKTTHHVMLAKHSHICWYTISIYVHLLKNPWGGVGREA